MGVGDDEHDLAKAAAGELAQERGPEGLGLRRADIHAQHLAPAVGVEADRDDHCHRDDAAVLAHIQVGRSRSTDTASRFPAAARGTPSPVHRSRRRAGSPGSSRCRSSRSPSPGRRPAASRRRGYRPPGSPRSAPSPPSVAAPGSRRSTSPSAASGRAAPPSLGRVSRPGRRCAGTASRSGLFLPRRRRSGRNSIGRSAAKPIISRRMSASGSSPPVRAGSSSRRSSGISGSGWVVATRPYRRTRDGHRDTARPPALHPRRRAAALPTSYTTTGDTTAPQIQSLRNHGSGRPRPSRSDRFSGRKQPLVATPCRWNIHLEHRPSDLNRSLFERRHDIARCASIRRDRMSPPCGLGAKPPVPRLDASHRMTDDATRASKSSASAWPSAASPRRPPRSRVSSSPTV